MFREKVDGNKDVAFSAEHSDLYWHPVRPVRALSNVVPSEPKQPASRALKEAAIFLGIFSDRI
jgi:hypothetical protein